MGSTIDSYVLTMPHGRGRCPFPMVLPHKLRLHDVNASQQSDSWRSIFACSLPPKIPVSGRREARCRGENTELRARSAELLHRQWSLPALIVAIFAPKAATFAPRSGHMAAENDVGNLNASLGISGIRARMANGRRKRGRNCRSSGRERLSYLQK